MRDVHEKSIGVIGGAGFIGSHLVDVLLKENPKKVSVLDNLSTGSLKNLNAAKDTDTPVEIVDGDAAHPDIFEKFVGGRDIDVIFNLGVTPLPASLDNPRESYENNVDIVLNAVEALRFGEFESLIHVSSSEVYGDCLYSPMDESHPLNPKTPYAASKAASDHIVSSYWETFEIDAAIVRPFNTYGPRQNSEEYAGLIPSTLNRIQNNEPPVIYGAGDQTRDWTYVRDIANAIANSYKEPKTREEIVNVCQGDELSVKEVVEQIIEITGWEGEIDYQPERPGDVHRHHGDNSRAKHFDLLDHTTPFRTGIEKTISWYFNR